MRLRAFRTFLALSATLLFVVYFTLWKLSEKPLHRFLVKVPPLSKWDDAPPETFYWEFQKFLFPQIEVPNPIPEGVPNFCGLLYVSLSPNGNVKINSQDITRIDYTHPLTEKLSEVFREREQAGVFEPNSDKIVKAVIIRASISAKYGEVAKVVDAVKSSGAEPIILQIDDLTE